jgi:hypothetical protein
MVWLVLAVLPAIALIITYWLEFTRLFPDVKVSWIGGAVTLAIVGAVVTLALSYAAMWLPGVTPRKFRYRPRALLLGRRRLAR